MDPVSWLPPMAYVLIGTLTMWTIVTEEDVLTGALFFKFVCAAVWPIFWLLALLLVVVSLPMILVCCAADWIAFRPQRRTTPSSNNS